MDAHHIGPEWDALRHAQLLAALHNGALVKPDKRPFKPDDFMPPDPWAPPKPPDGVATAQDFMAQLVASGLVRGPDE